MSTISEVGQEEAGAGARITINARFVTHRMTGVQRYAYEVSRRLPGSCWIAPSDAQPQYEVPGGALRVASSRFLKSHLWEQLALPFQVRKGDLLFSPANVGPLTVEHQVLTVHDISHLEHPEWFGRAYATLHGILLPRLVHRVRHVLTDSEFSRQRIMEFLGVPEGRITAVPLGVDPRFQPVAQGEVGRVCTRLGLDQPYVLVVGSLDPRKNLGRLLRAWKQVQAVEPDLVLAVSGATAACFPDLGLKEAPQGVRMLGYVADEDLPALYTGARAFAFPSLYEGFGLPPLEAMACGTPVVVANAASLPEVVGSAGEYVDPTNEEEIAEGILRVVQDDLLHQRLRKEGMRQAEQFTWERTGALTQDVLSRYLS